MVAKKLALVIALACAAAGSAQAADVELFGRFDTGFLFTSNSGQSKDSLQMSSGHTTGSR